MTRVIKNFFDYRVLIIMAASSPKSSNETEGTETTEVTDSQEDRSSGGWEGGRDISSLPTSTSPTIMTPSSSRKNTGFSFASVVSAVTSSSMMTREGSGRKKNSIKSNTTSNSLSSKGNCDTSTSCLTSSSLSSTQVISSKRGSREGRGSNEASRSGGSMSPSPASSPQPTVLIRDTSSPFSSMASASSSGTTVIGWKTAKAFSKTLSSIEVTAGGAAAGTSVVHHRIPPTSPSPHPKHHVLQQTPSSSRPAAIRIQMMEPVGPSAYSLSLAAQRTPSEQWKLLKNRLMRKKSTEENPFSPEVIEKMRQSLKVPPVAPVIISSSTSATSRLHHASPSSGGSPVSASGDDGGIVFRTNELKNLLKGSIERGDYHSSSSSSTGVAGNEIMMMIPSSNRSSNRSSFDTTSEGDDKSNIMPATFDKKFGISDAAVSLMTAKSKETNNSFGKKNNSRKTSPETTSCLEKEDTSPEAVSSQVKWDEVSHFFLRQSKSSMTCVSLFVFRALSQSVHLSK